MSMGKIWSGKSLRLSVGMSVLAAARSAERERRMVRMESVMARVLANGCGPLCEGRAVRLCG